MRVPEKAVIQRPSSDSHIADTDHLTSLSQSTQTAAIPVTSRAVIDVTSSLWELTLANLKEWDRL